MMQAYNPNVNIFNAMQIIFEYSAGGLVYPWARFLPISFADQEGAPTNMVLPLTRCSHSHSGSGFLLQKTDFQTHRDTNLTPI